MVRKWILATLPVPYNHCFRGGCGTLTFQIQRMAAEVLSLAAPSPKKEI